MRLAVTTGARRNVGDHLIHSRGRALLARLVPDAELVTVPRWDALASTEEFDGLVLCGGPGVRHDFFPETFRVLDGWDLAKPTLPLALGLQGTAHLGRTPKFNMASLEMLRALSDAGHIVGARDELTAQSLADVGAKARMTGCVAWYGPNPTIDLFPVGQVRSLVVTTPAHVANMGLFTRMLPGLARRFWQAKRSVVFHAGWTRRWRRPLPRVRAEIRMRAAARALGFHVVDASGDLGAIDAYGQIDLHVGFRVHAHLAFLSLGRPSVLVCEDARGIGQALTLGDPFRLDCLSGVRAVDILTAVDEEVASGFAASKQARSVMAEHWPAMTDHVRTEFPH